MVRSTRSDIEVGTSVQTGTLCRTKMETISALLWFPCQGPWPRHKSDSASARLCAAPTSLNLPLYQWVLLWSFYGYLGPNIGSKCNWSLLRYTNCFPVATVAVDEQGWELQLSSEQPTGEHLWSSSSEKDQHPVRYVHWLQIQSWQTGRIPWPRSTCPPCLSYPHSSRLVCFLPIKSSATRSVRRTRIAAQLHNLWCNWWPCRERAWVDKT